MTQTTITNVPLPEGTKDSPFKRSCRLVGSRTNNSLIIGIPKIVAEMANIGHGSVMNIWYEPNVGPDSGEKKGRIIIESRY